MTKERTSAVVVGAGPTGLTLALQLARCSIPVRVIDSATEFFPGSRGKAVQPRVMEIFDDLGIARRAVTPLYSEPRVAVLPVGHRLAGKEQITEADLAGEPLVWHADKGTQPTRRPHPNAGYLALGVDETLEHVAAGGGISFLARSATVFYSHPQISYVPVLDLAPDQVFIAVAASRASPVVDDFLAAARATADVTAECGNDEMWRRGGGASAP
jgi:choline dehydrogenase-like flavoprotein